MPGLNPIFVTSPLRIGSFDRAYEWLRNGSKPPAWPSAATRFRQKDLPLDLGR